MVGLVLAGFGVAALHARSRRIWQLAAVAVVVPVLVVVESLAMPITCAGAWPLMKMKSPTTNV